MKRQTSCIMKSEYDMSHRTSLSSFSRVGGTPRTSFRGLATGRLLTSLLAEERPELRLDGAGRVAGLEPDDALDDHLAVEDLVAVLAVELLRDRREDRVAGEDAVEGGQQRDAHLRADLAGVVKRLEHEDEAHDRSDHPERRRVGGHGVVRRPCPRVA